MPVLYDGLDDKLNLAIAFSLFTSFVKGIDTPYGSISSASETSVTIQGSPGEMILTGDDFVFEETDDGYDVSRGTIHKIEVDRNNHYSAAFSMEELSLDWAEMVAIVVSPEPFGQYLSSFDWVVYAGNDRDESGTRYVDSDYFPNGIRVYLGAGRDDFDGGSARDFIYGGTGDDRLVGGRGRDKVVGQNGDDSLYGGAHRDLVKGGGGDDGIVGGGGNDRLVGGAGADRFIFSPKHGSDKIRDFDLEVDLIYLSRKKVAFTLSDTAEGAVISYGSTSVLVAGVDAADLTEDHILY